MATRQLEIEHGEYRVLEPDRDLKAFDNDAVSLVMKYQLHGWIGRMSSNNHALMRSPDGTATASVSRKSNRGRSGRNGERPLNQWLEKRAAEHEAELQTTAFGVPEHKKREWQWRETALPPWQAAAEQSYDARLRMHKALTDWWKAFKNGEHRYQLVEERDDQWVVLESEGPKGPIRLVASGPAVAPADIEDMLAQIARINNKETHPMDDAGPLTDKETGKETDQEADQEFPCTEPGCGRSFPTKGALVLHGYSHDSDGFACPLCPRVLGTPAARGLHLAGKLHADDPRLPKAMAMLKAGKKRHPRKKGAPDRACEYCGMIMPARSISGHYRGHKNAGDIKIADGGTPPTTAITAPAITPKAPEAVTAPSATAEALAVRTVPLATLPEPAAVVNGTGHKDTPDEVLNRVRALINPELVGELERLRATCHRLESEVETLTRQRDDLQAWKDMIKEASNA
jgi:hypothetical protein